MVGPVAQGYELHAPLDRRLDDKASLATDVPKEAAWRESFVVPERPQPAVGLDVDVVQCAAGDAGAAPSFPPVMGPSSPGGQWRVALRSARPAGMVTVTLLDHHGDPITQGARVEAGRAWTVVAFDVPPEVEKAAFGIEALHVRIEDLARAGAGKGPWDYVTSPSVFSAGNDLDDELAGQLLERGHTVIGAFTIGGGESR